MIRTLAAACAALALGVALATTVHSQDAPAPERLGFLDVKKTFEGYRKAKDVKDQTKKKSDDLVASFRQRGANVEKETDRLSTLNPGTDEYVALTRQIRMEKYALDMDKEMAGRQLEAEQRKKNAMIYREICQEAEAYSQEQGLAAVLLHIPAETEMENDLDLLVATRAVLSRDERLDVTKAIVDRLNSQLPPPPK
jgi:Skp family chaperone for outer membrane proteins